MGVSKHLTQIGGGEPRSSATIDCVLLEERAEKVRCIEIQGVKHFEFWIEQGKCVRFEADALMVTLMSLRGNASVGDDWFPQAPDDKEADDKEAADDGR